MGDEDRRLLLRLLAAVTAAEDRLSEMQRTPEDDALVLMLRSAILEAELSFLESPAPDSEAGSITE
jgi:hypothetical protein